jgi:hypothetical protein
MRRLLAGAAIALFLSAVPALAQHQGGGGGGSGGGGSCAGDINSGCSQVSGTHLGSPLPVSQGGTGASSAGAAAANNIAALAEANNLSDLASASSARGNLGVAPGCGLSQSGSTLQVNATLGNNGAAITGATYSVQGSNATHPDCGTLLLFTGSSASTWTLAAASATGFGAGFGFSILNAGTAAITLNVTTSTVYPGSVSSIVIPPDENVAFQSDGTNYELAWASAGLSGEIPNCQDSGGNHLNFNSTTNVISCGTSDSAGLVPIMGLFVAVQPQNTTKYYVLVGNSASQTTDATVLMPAPRAGTITFTSCLSSAAPGTGNSITLTLRVNSASPGSGTVCTISNSATTGTISGSGDSVSIGNTLDMQAVTSASLTSSVTLGWGLTYQ